MSSHFLQKPVWVKKIEKALLTGGVFPFYCWVFEKIENVEPVLSMKISLLTKCFPKNQNLKTIFQCKNVAVNFSFVNFNLGAGEGAFRH